MATAPKKKTTSADHAAFIKDAAVAAQASEKATGVPASVTIAQAILESSWGTRHMGDANNYFGIKATVKGGKLVDGGTATGFVDKPTKEVVKGKTITVVAHFRSYKNMSDSFTDHGMFLKNNKRYAKALAAYAATRDVDEFARGLQKAGYATDPAYASKLIKIMTANDLRQFNAK